MFSCSDIEPMIQDYVDGYLLPSQREVLESHVRSCAGCASLLAGLARIDGRFEELCEVEVPADLSRSILGALPPGIHAPSRVPQVLRAAALPLALVGLLTFGVLLKGRFDLRTAAGHRGIEIVFVAPAAASVSVVGDFNGWDPRRNRMVRSEHAGLWRTELKLPPGVYQYSFVVDGTVWTKDPLARKFLADGFGGENSVIIVDG